MSLFFLSWQADSQQWLHQIKIHLEALVDTFVLKPVMDTLSSSGINLFRVISFFSAGWKLLGRFQNQNKYQATFCRKSNNYWGSIFELSRSSIDNLEGFLLLN